MLFISTGTAFFMERTTTLMLFIFSVVMMFASLFVFISLLFVPGTATIDIVFVLKQQGYYLFIFISIVYKHDISITFSNLGRI